MIFDDIFSSLDRVNARKICVGLIKTFCTIGHTRADWNYTTLKGNKPLVLKNINEQLRAGFRLGVVGRTGSCITTKYADTE